nr:MAG TPA: hypothetical protein [Caudoviricetes sp.]DAP95995.1 MAG TPA: hypothetical protein [Caudoviricetes sp.]
MLRVGLAEEYSLLVERGVDINHSPSLLFETR